MTPDDRFRQYEELQRHDVSWTEQDALNVHSIAQLLEPHLGPIVDDFYEVIERHPQARRVITGGPAQIARLKCTLTEWLRELLAGPYDSGYVDAPLAGRQAACRDRARPGFTNVAVSRLRNGTSGSPRPFLASATTANRSASPSVAQ